MQLNHGARRDDGPRWHTCAAGAGRSRPSWARPRGRGPGSAEALPRPDPGHLRMRFCPQNASVIGPQVYGESLGRSPVGVLQSPPRQSASAGKAGRPSSTVPIATPGECRPPRHLAGPFRGLHPDPEARASGHGAPYSPSLFCSPDFSQPRPPARKRSLPLIRLVALCTKAKRSGSRLPASLFRGNLAN